MQIVTRNLGSRSFRSFGRRIAARVAALALSVACGESQGPAPEVGIQATHLPNIVVITLDTTRADHLGLYGYFRDTSPSLDEFAQEAVVFEQAIMPIATTLPTHLSLFTGTHPVEHGVLANTTHGGERFVPSPGLRSFAAIARQLGYHTGAFVSAAPLKRGSGIEHGFDFYDQPEEKQRGAQAATRAALSWLNGLGSARPFLLWIHYYDAHFPFEAPRRYRKLFQRDDELDRYMRERRFSQTASRPLVGLTDTAPESINGYDAELRSQDDQFSKVWRRLQSLPDWDSTAVLVMGDHGEGLCQHAEAGHGGIWQEQLRAPLLMRVPGALPRRVRTPISARDALPTLLGLLDSEDFPEFLESASGANVLSVGERPIVSQDTGRKLGVGHFEREDYRQALTHRGFKYVRTDLRDGGTSEQLFDLGVDPYELSDAAGRHPELVADMRETLDRELEEMRLRAGETRTVPADPELLAELCALGYLPCEDGRLVEADSESAAMP